MSGNRCGMGFWRRAAVVALVAFSAGLSGLSSLPASAKAANGQAPAPIETVAESQLPAQGRAVMMLIYQGGPFRHDKDGAVFANRERILAVKPRGYYREYTVRTPGVSHRGAKRIVCGGKQATAPDACFYTDDHYSSFRQIVR
ncbi:MAG: ribonuclease domain-containing protein [Pseudomonadota bacterium]